MPAVSSALDLVDGEVRELIRRRGLDPFTDPGPVRVLVRDVVADYSERSMSSSLPPVGDADGVVRDVFLVDGEFDIGDLERHLSGPSPTLTSRFIGAVSSLLPCAQGSKIFR